MVQCDKCGDEIYMPFRCNYCGGYFCAEHRLPEFHECTGIHRGLGSINIGRGRPYYPSDSLYRRQRRSSGYSSLFRFSERELRDLTISLLLIASFTLTFPSLRRFLLRSPLIVAGAVGIFAAAFLFHELAHKFAAQRLGYWAEFRLNMTGILITLMSLFLPIKIVAPGAVIIAGLMYGDDYGKISIVGPLTNIAQAAAYLAIYLTSRNPFLDALASAGITINSSLALFNLIPFGIFDGEKVYRWNWRIWLATVVVAGLLFLYPVL